MLYYLLYPLHTEFIGFNVIRYVTFRTLMAMFTAMTIYFIFGGPFIRMMGSKRFWQSVRDDGPVTHMDKRGTPTMGGLLMWASVFISALLWSKFIDPFVIVAFGGAIVGTILGLTFSKITALIDDHLIEITLTTILTYLAYIVAEYFETSGVISVIAAGLMVGTYGTKIGMSPTTRVSVKDFWDYIAFIINSVVFFIIGLEVGIVNIFNNIHYIIIAIFAVLLGRTVSMLILTQVVNRIDKKIDFKWQTIFIWGGVRGALAMALALAIPHDYEYRAIILMMTFGVVGFSLIVQGLSIGKLLQF